MRSLATNALEAHFSQVSSSYNEGIREKHITLELATCIINEGKEPKNFKKIYIYNPRNYEFL